MKSSTLNRMICIGLLTVLISVATVSFCLPDRETSRTERRLLQLFPDQTQECVLDGSWMKALERYWVDQFPARNFLRKLSARFKYHLLFQKDDHGVYLEQGHLAECEPPLNETSVDYAAYLMQRLVGKSFRHQHVAVAIIPDKHYYLAPAHGSPGVDLDRLIQRLSKQLSDWPVIDLSDCLTIEDYYRTDIHWRQENLRSVSDRILDEFGRSQTNAFTYQTMILEPFRGSLAARTALATDPDQLVYLTHPVLEQATIFDVEQQEMHPLYQPDLFDGVDGYDVFLGGASPLQILNNPTGSGHLLIFRDSFASSLAPLLLTEYETITLVDLRYVTITHLMSLLEPESIDDVLFLFSTRIINNSYLLRE